MMQPHVLLFFVFLGQFEFNSALDIVSADQNSAFFVSPSSLLQMSQSSSTSTSTVVSSYVSVALFQNNGDVEVIEGLLYISPILFHSMGLINITTSGSVSLSLTSLNNTCDLGLSLQLGYVTVSNSPSLSFGASMNESLPRSVSILNSGTLHIIAGSLTVFKSFLTYTTGHLLIDEGANLVLQDTDFNAITSPLIIATQDNLNGKIT